MNKYIMAEVHRSVMRLLTAFIMPLLCIGTSRGENRVDHFVTDSIIEPGIPSFIRGSLNNMSGSHVDIDFDLASLEPFTIYKVEWINLDTIRMPVEPFTLVAHPDTLTDKATLWRIYLEFPYTCYFGDDDILKIHTDKGVISRYLSEAGRRKAEIRELKKTHDTYVARSERQGRTVMALIIGAVVMLAVGGIWLFVATRRKIERRDTEIGELSMMVRERAELNIDLRNKVNALYRSRLDTLNMLCDAYFNNNESDKTKQLFYKNVENSILALRDDKSLEELEGIVNEYLDDTIARVRRQIPELSIGDLKFLTYLYAGFSPRAVCIFMDIKMKTFYNRRNLIKERILGSDAPDKERFVSLMAM